MLELKIYKSPWKAVKLILLSLPFVILSLSDLLHYSNISPAWVDWFGLCFLGLGILIGLFNLFDNRPELILNQDGIFDRMSYGIFDKSKDRGFVSWNSIKDARVLIQQNSFRGIKTSKHKFICFTLDKDAANKLNRNNLSRKISETFNLGDYGFSLMNLKNFDEQKFIQLIKLMSHSDIKEKQKLLNEFQP